MQRTFKGFNQVLNLPIARSQTRIQCDRGDLKSLSGLRISAGGQPPAEQSVHRALEGTAGAPDLLLNESGNIIVDGQSGPHTMMLFNQAS